MLTLSDKATIMLSAIRDTTDKQINKYIKLKDMNDIPHYKNARLENSRKSLFINCSLTSIAEWEE